MSPNERAERAKAILADPVMDTVFNDLRMRLVSQLEHLPIGDRDTQHEISLMLQLLQRIKLQLSNYVQEQTVEKHREKQDSFMARMRQSLTTGNRQ